MTTDFKSTKEAEDFIKDCKIKINEITRQIEDYKEALGVAKESNLEVDSDVDWLPRAQAARRLYGSKQLEAELWLYGLQPFSSSSTKPEGSNELLTMVKDLQEELSSFKKQYHNMRQELDSMSRKITKEREVRKTINDRFTTHRSFVYRAFNDLIKFTTPTITPCLENLKWVDSQIEKSPDWGLKLD